MHVALVSHRQDLFTVNCLIENKELKQTPFIVGKKLSLVFHKVLSLSQSYLMYLFVIYSQL